MKTRIFGRLLGVFALGALIGSGAGQVALAQTTFLTGTTTTDVPAGSSVTCTFGSGGSCSTSSISAVGNAEASANTPNANLTAAEPGSVADGDYCLYFEISDDSNPSTPTGLTQLNSSVIGSASAYAMNVYSQIYEGTAPQFVNINWPKVITRCYSGVNGVDQFGSTGSSSTIPALANSANTDEVYVAAMFSNTGTISNTTGDLGNTQVDQTQWPSFAGDKTLGTCNATVGAEAFSNGTNGAGLTLK